MQTDGRKVCSEEMSILYDTIRMDVTEISCKNLDICLKIG
jgi:hypothetical protein